MAHRHGYKWPHPQLFESLAKLQNSRFLFNMSQLQLLRAEGNYVESILGVLQSPQQVCPPPQLVWLSCRSCPFTSLPSSLPLNKLRVLELKDFSKLETPWQDDYQAPPELRKLVLMGCSNLRSLPDSFESLTNLEHIDLSRCSNLLRLPNYFWKLQNLKLLDLDGCSSLRGFPPRRWKLKSSEFWISETPNSVKDFKASNLHYFKIPQLTVYMFVFEILIVEQIQGSNDHLWKSVNFGLRCCCSVRDTKWILF